MPARKKPVTNRSKNTTEASLATHTSKIFAKAAKQVLAKNTPEDEKRSAMENMANSKVPVMNPS